MDESYEYSMESFEAFESDGDSMLILGAPIEFENLPTDTGDFFNDQQNLRNESVGSVSSGERGHRSDDSRRDKARTWDRSFPGQPQFTDGGPTDINETPFFSNSLVGAGAEDAHLSPNFDFAGFNFAEGSDTESIGPAVRFSRDTDQQLEPTMYAYNDDNDRDDGSDGREGTADALSGGEHEGDGDGEGGPSLTRQSKKIKKKRKKRRSRQPPPVEEPEVVAPMPISREAIAANRKAYVAPKPVVRPPALAEHQNEEFKRISIQNSVVNNRPCIPIPSITSNIVREVKPAEGFMLQRQYNIALKQIQAYRREREVLLSKLDSSAIEEELEKMRTAIIEKDNHIALLVEDLKGLKKQNRYQSECLQSMDRESKDGAVEEAKTLASYVLVLEERVRRLKIQLESTQKHDRVTSSEFEKQSKKLAKTLSQNEKLKRQLILSREQNQQLEQRMVDALGGGSLVGGDSEHNGSIAEQGTNNEGEGEGEGEGESRMGPGDEVSSLLPLYQQLPGRKPNSVSRANSIFGGSKLHQESSVLSSTTAGSRQHSARAMGQQSAQSPQHAHGGVHATAEMVKKLQKSLDLQRDSFIRQLTNLQSELKNATADNSKLREEIFQLEVNARSQKLAVKHLRDAYEGLADGQRRLHTTSNNYFEGEQRKLPQSAPSAMQPQPPQAGRPLSMQAHRRMKAREGVLSDGDGLLEGSTATVNSIGGGGGSTGGGGGGSTEAVTPGRYSKQRVHAVDGLSDVDCGGPSLGSSPVKHSQLNSTFITSDLAKIGAFQNE